MADLLFLFAPGAGAPSSHPWMQHWKERLAALGRVVTFDYDYMRDRRRRPDPPAQLIGAHRLALSAARQEQPDAAIILIGKSMGGRIGCHVSLEENVDALVCLGYPLCGGGDPKKLRDKVLREICTPILFVQGTRDSLCPLPLLEKARTEMSAPSQLHHVEGGDHSLVVSKTHLKASGETQDQVDEQILAAIAAFLGEVIDPTRLGSFMDRARPD